ncbi:MAG: hypothetical protein M9908_10985 [Phyllobacteriaceae bacterium]|nr:hypothetical protein [Phyllobacteriaceae bacterium]
MTRNLVFIASAATAGLLVGTTAWLWHVHGASVFIAMTESLLAWCL